MLLLTVALMLLMVTQVHSFLAYSKPIKADALVVEGWLRDEALKGALVEFNRGNYQLLITTGLPLPRGTYLSQYKTTAELTAATLMALGFDRSKLVVVPAPKALKDRTEASAVALRQWLIETGKPIHSINLYSQDVHTRRSWLLFKRVLEPEVKVGAIANPTADYDPRYWWTTSTGARSVISETIAYLYSKLFRWSQ